MVDFDLSFINAVHPFQAGRNITCCFFHFAANIKKKARPIIETIKKAVGQNTPEVRLAEKIKRAVMMLPLLPIDLITVEVVQIIFGRWSAAFPGRAGDFAKLHHHVMKNYVGPRARFHANLWCVSGRATRTNNAAESSHAVLNASVRVSGAVSLNMFLFAIERQMQNTTREIEAGCPSHTKAIFARRNTLLAQELSDLITGQQGVLGFLDHCSDIMKVKNLTGVQLFATRRMGELLPPGEASWKTATLFR